MRGFQEREIAKDQGTRASVEIYTPNIASLFGLSDVRAQALAFYDTAQVRQNQPLPGEQASENIASTGLGLRLGYARNLSIKFDYGIVTQAAGTQKVGGSRLHGSLLWFF